MKDPAYFHPVTAHAPELRPAFQVTEAIDLKGPMTAKAGRWLSSSLHQEAFTRFGEFALWTDDWVTILNEACRLASAALDVPFAKILELDGEGSTMLVRGGYGWKPGIVGHARIPAGVRSAERQALETAKPVVVADINTDQRFDYPDFLREHGIRAIATVPIVTASNDAIISFAPEDGRIISWNGGAERMFGYTEREALGAPVGLLLPDDQPQGKLNEVFERAMAGQPVVAYETERLAKDGERVPVSISAARMLAPDGRITGVSGILHDLRPRKQAEAALQDSTDQLRQSQKMEAIGRLAAGVAHDFNNLLQAITGGLELVMDEIAPDSPAHEFIAISLSSAKRGAGLTHQLLAYARKQVLWPQAVDLSSFLPEMRQLLARTLGPRIAVRARAAAGTPPILVDPGQLETALLNLAVNAAHAMPNGGVLLLDAHLDDKDGNVVIAVTDTGMGMDEATVAKVFEPFFTTKGTEGTGLGLSMVQGFAEQSGGHAQVASTPGKGTTIMLWLPVITQAREDAGGVQAVHRTGAMPRGSGRVLLVDDEPDVLLTAGAFLERAGFAVTRASSGEEALALLTTERFEVLVTDHAMPGISGTDLITHARSLDPGLPALLVSGFTETNGPQATPGAALLRKPFERRALLDAVLEALGRQQAENTTSPRRSEDRSQDENLGAG